MQALEWTCWGGRASEEKGLVLRRTSSGSSPPFFLALTLVLP